MADWKKLLRDVLLADGKIDADEAALLRREIMADGTVDDEERAFLRELKDGAGDSSPEFEALCDECLK